MSLHRDSLASSALTFFEGVKGSFGRKFYAFPYQKKSLSLNGLCLFLLHFEQSALIFMGIFYSCVY